MLWASGGSCSFVRQHQDSVCCPERDKGERGLQAWAVPRPSVWVTPPRTSRNFSFWQRLPEATSPPRPTRPRLIDLSFLCTHMSVCLLVADSAHTTLYYCLSPYVYIYFILQKACISQFMLFNKLLQNSLLKTASLHLVHDSGGWPFGLGSAGWFFWSRLGSFLYLLSEAGLLGSFASVG